MMENKIPVEVALSETGYKKKYIAEKLGITPEYLPRYLRNSKELSIKSAAIICELTNKSFKEIDFGVDSIFFGT